MRLKAVTNIQKITKSMKMVSAAKYARAERELKPARSYGLGAKSAFSHTPHFWTWLCVSEDIICLLSHLQSNETSELLNYLLPE